MLSIPEVAVRSKRRWYMTENPDRLKNTGLDLFALTGQRLRDALWVMRARRMAGWSIVVFVIIGAILHVPMRTVPLLIVGVHIIACNNLLRRIVRRTAPGNLSAIRAIWVAQVAGDIAFITGLIFFCGGAVNPMFVAYVLPVVVAGVFLSPAQTYATAASGAILFACVTAIQAKFPGLYNPLPYDILLDHSHMRAYAISVVSILTAILFLFAFLSSAVSRRVRAAEAELVGNRDLLDSIITGMPEGLIFLAPGGDMLLANRAAADWFGDGSGADAHPAVTEACLPPALTDYVERVSECSSTVADEKFTFAVGADGEDAERRTFRASTSSVVDCNGGHLGYVILIEDVTEQLRMEVNLLARNREVLAMSEKLETNRKEMAQREKMVAIGTMAAGVAHEIGNPLTAISTIIQRLKGRPDTPLAQLQSVDRQIERIVQIVRGMLAFAKPTGGDPVLVDIDELIQETISIARYSRHARDVRIDNRHNCNLPKIRTVAQQFQQVMVNVLLNAFDALADVMGEKLITIESAKRGDCVDVTVTDNGCGMTQEQIQQAFEPFFTTKAPGEGTGLGLAVSYSLVERQGGHMSIRSRPGYGTSVMITLKAEIAGKAAQGTSSSFAAERGPRSSHQVSGEGS
jgi:signal transduction histidine kinase